MSSTSPVGVHPDNPHYFVYRGEPLILVSSGDIYYDVFSPRQDFVEYLDTIAAYGSNFTRFYPAGCTAFVPSDGDRSILPMLILYFLGSGRIIENITQGAVKQ